MQTLTVIRHDVRLNEELRLIFQYRCASLWRTATGLLFGVGIAMIISSCDFQEKLIPRELLFGNPEKVQPQISPDGKNLAYLAPRDGVLNIWVRSVQGADARSVTSEKGRGISNYFWAYDSKHLLFLQDQNGDENTHLYRVDLVTGEKKDLTPFAGVRAQVLASEKTYPDTLLIGLNRINPKFFDVYRLNWRTGELVLAAQNDERISDWIADSNLQVRGALVSNEDGGATVMIRDSEDLPWRKVADWGFEDSFGCNVVGFSKDGKSLYLIDSREAQASRLVQLEILTGEKRVLASDPEYDVVGVMIHPDTRAVQWVSWIKDKVEWQVLDSSVAGDMEKIQNLYGKNFSLLSRDDADQNWVLRVETDRSPVSYFLYHRQTGKSDFLFEHQPALKKYKLAEMKPVSFKSRDGLTLHGYLTLPYFASEPSAQMAKPNKPLPMVLKVHGGPWNRDVWGYDSRVQWLANRGYACLQVNFRGSTTYGKNFLNAGNKEWGGKMQDDLTDAVNWAVSEGIADPKRIAIFGGSYGGYAALAGAAFTPDLFQAAISVVGPSNLMTFIQTTPAYWATELTNIYRRVGNPNTEADFLKSRSPLLSVDRIRIPILIAQGANDPRVNQAESDQIVMALRARGIPCEYLLFGDEGHGFGQPVNQLKFYKNAEMFLAQHLGGRVEK